MLRRYFLAGGAAAAFGAGAKDSFVWKAGEGEYHTYRIPAVIRTKKGTLLAFCEGRKEGRGDSGDIDLLLKRSANDGQTWSDSQVIANLGSDTIGNPAPVVDRRDGMIHLLLTRNPGNVTERQIIDRSVPDTRTVWIIRSRDDGKTWDEPSEITADVKDPDWTWYATGPCNGIQLRSGRLLIPCDHVRSDKSMWSHVIYSDDRGRSWKRGGNAGPECNESTMAELGDGSLMLNMRSYAKKNRRAVSLSSDGGITWSTPELQEDLIEPVCQASLIRTSRGILLFSNPASQKRENMTVKASADGRAWRTLHTIHEGPSAYSNLVELRRGSVGLLYERGAASPYDGIAWTTFSVKLP